MSVAPSFALLQAPALAEFFARDFGVRCVHWPAAFTPASLDVAASFDARRFLGAVDAARVDASGRQQQASIEPGAIDAALASGATICADVTREPSLAALLAELATWVPSVHEPAFAKLYASPAGAGFAMHMDAHHVFVVQLRGRKAWRVSDAVVSAPLVGGKLEAGRPVHTHPNTGDPILDDRGEPLEAPTDAILRTFEMSPGDVLYVPPGAWHTTTAIEASVAVSLSPPRAPALRLVLAVLEQALASQASWRRDLVRGPAGAGAVPAAVASALQTCARELGLLVGDVDGVLLERAWAIAALTGGEATRPGSPSALRRSSVLAHADARGFFHTLDPTPPGRVHLVFSGGELELPREALPFVEGLAAHAQFRADAALSWDPRLDWDAARELLGQLVEVGLLAIVPG